MKLLIFDIDGTLLRASPAPERAFDRACQELFGVTGAWGNTPMHGRTDPHIFRDAAEEALGHRLGPDQLALLHQCYIKHFRSTISESREFTLLPGVLELCKLLSEHNDYLLGIETGNFEDSGKLKLKRGEIDHFFSYGGYGSDSPDRSEIVATAIARAKQVHKLREVNRQDIFVIGDAPQDIAAAKTQRVNSIAVCTGRHTREDLQLLEPGHILPDLSDSADFLNIVEG